MAMQGGLSKADYRKRVLAKLATRPMTLWPFLAGWTVLLSGWALGLKGGAVVFGGVVALLVGAGTFLTGLLTGGERVRQEVLEEIQREAESARENELDDLDRRLVEDGDPRTEQSLRELRALASSFREKSSWYSDIETTTSFDILSGVDELFDSCVKYLRSTLELWRTAARMETREAREPILERRDELIDDVRTTIRHISKILARVQTLGLKEHEGSNLGRLREELDTSLAVAQRVQERIAGWDLQDYRIGE
jgi:hypothetical protein